MLYSYRCIDARGGVRDGRIDAGSSHEARQRLERKGWRILIIQSLAKEDASPEEETEFAADRWLREGPAAEGEQEPGSDSEPMQEEWPEDWMANVRCPATIVVLFTRQLATMLNAGLPLLHALDSLSVQHEYPLFGEVISSVADHIERGHTLSSALSRFPRVFSKVYISMVLAGEKSGQMGPALDRLAGWQERDFKLFKKMKNALTYPTFVLSLSCALGLILFYTVLPGFVDVLEKMDVELPLVTRMVFWVTNLVKNPGAWIVGLAVTIGLGTYLRDLYKTERGSVAIFRFLLSVPLLGSMLRFATTARFTATTAALLESGIDLVRSVSLGARASGSPVLACDAENVAHSIRNGETLSACMAGRPDIYPGAVTQMVRAGEESSSLAPMFKRVAGYYDTEVNFKIETLAVALEPMLLALVASVVGTVVISIFIPMYGYLSKLGG